MTGATCTNGLNRRQTTSRFCAWICLGAVGLLCCFCGCRGGADTRRDSDRALLRRAEAGHQAFAEGDLAAAIKEFRSAIRRAWALDDPHESGTIAYNLAACMTSLGRNLEARDWLLEARQELGRAGQSPANTWLLQAKVAMAEHRFEDAVRNIDDAARCDPPCNTTEATHHEPTPRCQSCAARIPCLGKKISRKQNQRACELEFQTQIYLARARVAAEQYNLAAAGTWFARACELASQLDSHAIQAELHDIAALIDIATGQYEQAGCHLDNEAAHLRLAGNYREIPNTLRLAAAAYRQAERTDLAADRTLRVARILFGRGDTAAAWEQVREAASLGEIAAAEVTNIRLALLTYEMSRALGPEASSATEPGSPAETLPPVEPPLLPAETLLLPAEPPLLPAEPPLRSAPTAADGP